MIIDICIDSILLFVGLFVVYRHTGVVVFGREFFYGGTGIEFCAPVSLCVRECVFVCVRGRGMGGEQCLTHTKVHSRKLCSRK